MMKIVNIDGKILHIFWKTWGISKKFSGKMWLMIILKVTKNQGFIISLEDTVSENSQAGQLDTPSRFRVNMVANKIIYIKLCVRNLVIICTIFSWVVNIKSLQDLEFLSIIVAVAYLALSKGKGERGWGLGWRGAKFLEKGIIIKW